MKKKRNDERLPLPLRYTKTGIPKYLMYLAAYYIETTAEHIVRAMVYIPRRSLLEFAERSIQNTDDLERSFD